MYEVKHFVYLVTNTIYILSVNTRSIGLVKFYAALQANGTPPFQQRANSSVAMVLVAEEGADNW